MSDSMHERTKQASDGIAQVESKVEQKINRATPRVADWANRWPRTPRTTTVSQKKG